MQPQRSFGMVTGSLGSLPTFAAAAHEINAKSEGEWRHCGTFLPFAAVAKDRLVLAQRTLCWADCGRSLRGAQTAAVRRKPTSQTRPVERVRSYVALPRLSVKRTLDVAAAFSQGHDQVHSLKEVTGKPA